MKVSVVGGGPAGLFLALLLKRADPRHDITVFERNQHDETWGFGVVFSDATEDALAQADPAVTAAMAKAFATEAAQRIVNDAVQILGGRGVLASHPVDRLYRAVRALRIYEGTTEIQHLIVAGQLLKQAGGEGAA